eukprot:CAMPEP_0194550772 /NCGR_PEP_ID=MMETSP0253-20130528/95881_1 /TAXON_ID=2966 /ORGANISM="Noctiluca scintillans" /LENGTH=548 /DNA_ID=CAMNT_0039398217 /DNA_START=39 /DNA_END=1684 /DNA_ORIENTATION=+
MAHAMVLFGVMVTSSVHGAVIHQSSFAISDVEDTAQSTPDTLLRKAVWAQSARSIKQSTAWKTRHVPADFFNATYACGDNARFAITNLTMGSNHFGVHAVYAAGVGGSRSATSGEISVERLEDILDDVIDGSTYSPWMDNHLALYRYDLDSVVSKFRQAGQTFLVLSWKADGMTFYSVIAHVPMSQEIYEFISPQKPTVEQEIHSFPVARHYFGGRFQSAEPDNRNVALHYSQTTRDLAHSVNFFKDVLGYDPVHQGTFDGGRYAIFDITVDSKGSYMHMHHGQLQLWERDDAKSGSYSPAWFEEYVENTTLSDYQGTLKTCWSVWGDNHVTFSGVPGAVILQVVARYEQLGIPYKVFTDGQRGHESCVFSVYLMLPGGRWMEMHPEELTATTEGAEVWDTGTVTRRVALGDEFVTHTRVNEWHGCTRAVESDFSHLGHRFAKSGSYSPAWFEEYVEEKTFANYTTSSETCWTIWGDNHFTFYDVPEAYIYQVVARYKELELPYKEFRIPVGDEALLFSAYFMLPGGRWFEVHPKDSSTKATANAELW